MVQNIPFRTITSPNKTEDVISRYRSMKALRNHFTGEVNATRNISKAEQLCDYLHYKNERSIAFELFLT